MANSITESFRKLIDKTSLSFLKTKEVSPKEIKTGLEELESKIQVYNSENQYSPEQKNTNSDNNKPGL